jgi:hypothetical protein
VLPLRAELVTKYHPDKELVNMYFNPLFKYNWRKTLIRYVLQPLNIVDLIAILPFYVRLFVENVESTSVIRVFRVARTIRFVRSHGKFKRSLMVLDRTIIEAAPMILFLVYLLVVALIVCGAIIYYAEQGKFTVTPEYPDGVYLRPAPLGEGKERSPFESILIGIYWSAVTTTTVGYGDVYPTTPWGRLFAGVCAIIGVMVIALPVTVLSTHFHVAYNEIYLHTPDLSGGTTETFETFARTSDGAKGKHRVFQAVGVQTADGHFEKDSEHHVVPHLLPLPPFVRSNGQEKFSVNGSQRSYHDSNEADPSFIRRVSRYDTNGEDAFDDTYQGPGHRVLGNAARSRPQETYESDSLGPQGRARSSLNGSMELNYSTGERLDTCLDGTLGLKMAPLALEDVNDVSDLQQRDKKILRQLHKLQRDITRMMLELDRRSKETYRELSAGGNSRDSATDDESEQKDLRLSTELGESYQCGRSVTPPQDAAGKCESELCKAEDIAQNEHGVSCDGESMVVNDTEGHISTAKSNRCA